MSRAAPFHFEKGATTTTTKKWPFHLRRAINSGARDSKSKWIGLRGNIPSKRREKTQKKVRGAQENCRDKKMFRMAAWTDGPDASHKQQQPTITTHLFYFIFLLFFDNQRFQQQEKKKKPSLKTAFYETSSSPGLQSQFHSKPRGGNTDTVPSFSLSLFLSYLGCYAWPNKLRNGFVLILPFFFLMIKIFFLLFAAM